MSLKLEVPNKFKKDHDLIVALDIGFSTQKKSCGLAWNRNSKKGRPESKALQFGATIGKIFELASNAKSMALIIEAPLSVHFSKNGNPKYRFPLEKNSGWYWGAGILTHGAALVLLKGLYFKSQSKPTKISIYEAFSLNKNTYLCDKHEAELILDLFRKGATGVHSIAEHCIGIKKFYHLEKMDKDQIRREKIKNSPPPKILKVDDSDRKNWLRNLNCEDCAERNIKANKKER